MLKNKKGHLMPIPVGFHLEDMLNFAIMSVPFLIIYFWHIWHDHRHNNKIARKLDEIILLLRKRAEENAIRKK